VTVEVVGWGKVLSNQPTARVLLDTEVHVYTLSCSFMA
jgi:hypothetical protein